MHIYYSLAHLKFEMQKLFLPRRVMLITPSSTFAAVAMWAQSLYFYAHAAFESDELGERYTGERSSFK
jgi:hypothetical protein